MQQVCSYTSSFDTKAQLHNMKTKAEKVFFMTRLNWIDATRFSKQAKRELKLCDLRDISIHYIQIKNIKHQY